MEKNIPASLDDIQSDPENVEESCSLLLRQPEPGPDVLTWLQEERRLCLGN